MTRRISFLVGLVAVMAVAAVLVAGPKDRRNAMPRDVTLTGKIVDLHNAMTGKFPSTDHARCTMECIKAGVPAAIETEDGLVIVGEGVKGPRMALVPHAFKSVEIKGKLYERSGIRYIDLATVKALGTEPNSGEEADEGRDSEAYDEDAGQKVPEADAEGACCLSDGNCLETSYQNCQGENGRFFEGYSCDDIECGP